MNLLKVTRLGSFGSEPQTQRSSKAILLLTTYRLPQQKDLESIIL